MQNVIVASVLEKKHTFYIYTFALENVTYTHLRACVRVDICIFISLLRVYFNYQLLLIIYANINSLFINLQIIFYFTFI